MPAKSVIACCHTLLAQDLTIAFVESASTGRLVYDFTSVPECGKVVRGGIVCYDRSVKEELLKVPAQVIDKYTAESPEVTQMLAEGLQDLIPADVIVAVTGLASPGGSETEQKPVGTMYVHSITKGRAWKTTLLFDGSPDEIIAKTIEAIAALLLEELTK